LGDLEEQFAHGEFSQLREWLREQIYKYGSIHPPRELLQRVTGSALDPEPYLEYLRTKFA
jgi:carboxypeptidase Taq